MKLSKISTTNYLLVRFPLLLSHTTTTILILYAKKYAVPVLMCCGSLRLKEGPGGGAWGSAEARLWGIAQAVVGTKPNPSAVLCLLARSQELRLLRLVIHGLWVFLWGFLWVLKHSWGLKLLV